MQFLNQLKARFNAREAVEITARDLPFQLKRTFCKSSSLVAKALNNGSKGSTGADAACAVIVLQRDDRVPLMQNSTSEVRHISGVDRRCGHRRCSEHVPVDGAAER
jgi:hypothetical protein